MIRNAKIDNMRGLAIVGVVFFHFTAYSALLSGMVHEALLIFMIPFLIFISGMVSKNTADSQIKAVKNILIPLIIFNIVFLIFLFIIGRGHSLEYFLLIPEFGLWYLLSLFWWRSFLPVMDKIKHIFVISIILALVVGLFSFKTGLLSISRTLCFLPVFLAGYYFGSIKEKLDKIPFNNYIWAILLAVLVVVSTLILTHFSSMIYMLNSYHDAGLDNILGMVVRLLLIIVGILGSIILYTIITKKEFFLTKIGKNSLEVYVFHFYFLFILPVILKLLGLNYIFKDTLLSIAYVIIATGIVVYLLSLDVFAKYINKMINYIQNLLFKKESISDIK